MINIFHNLDDAAKKYGKAGNYVVGANIAGFEKVVGCDDRTRNCINRNTEPRNVDIPGLFLLSEYSLIGR